MTSKLPDLPLNTRSRMSSKEHRQKQMGPLPSALYDLFVESLQTIVVPSYAVIKQTDPSFAKMAIGSKYKQENATYRYMIRCRFRNWATKMYLGPDGTQLFCLSSNRPILPLETMKLLIMNIHTNSKHWQTFTPEEMSMNPSGSQPVSSTDAPWAKHKSLPAVVHELQKLYAFGRRQFGPSVSMVHRTLRSCPLCAFRYSKGEEYSSDSSDSGEEMVAEDAPSLTPPSSDSTVSLDDTHGEKTEDANNNFVKPVFKQNTKYKMSFKVKETGRPVLVISPEETAEEASSSVIGASNSSSAISSSDNSDTVQQKGIPKVSKEPKRKKSKQNDSAAKKANKGKKLYGQPSVVYKLNPDASCSKQVPVATPELPTNKTPFVKILPAPAKVQSSSSGQLIVDSGSVEKIVMMPDQVKPIPQSTVKELAPKENEPQNVVVKQPPQDSAPVIPKKFTRVTVKSRGVGKNAKIKSLPQERSPAVTYYRNAFCLLAHMTGEEKDTTAKTPENNAETTNRLLLIPENAAAVSNAIKPVTSQSTTQAAISDKGAVMPPGLQGKLDNLDITKLLVFVRNIKAPLLPANPPVSQISNVNSMPVISSVSTTVHGTSTTTISAKRFTIKPAATISTDCFTKPAIPNQKSVAIPTGLTTGMPAKTIPERLTPVAIKTSREASTNSSWEVLKILQKPALIPLKTIQSFKPQVALQLQNSGLSDAIKQVRKRIKMQIENKTLNKGEQATLDEQPLSSDNVVQSTVSQNHTTQPKVHAASSTATTGNESSLAFLAQQITEEPKASKHNKNSPGYKLKKILKTIQCMNKDVRPAAAGDRKSMDKLNKRIEQTLNLVKIIKENVNVLN